MNRADRIAEQSSERLLAALKAGEPPEPAILAAHQAFARCAADVWFVACCAGPSALPRADEHKRVALAEQVAVVTDVNKFFFGADASLDFIVECQRAVEASFHARCAELMAGWRR